MDVSLLVKVIRTFRIAIFYSILYLLFIKNNCTFFSKIFFPSGEKGEHQEREGEAVLHEQARLPAPHREAGHRQVRHLPLHPRRQYQVLDHGRGQSEI